MAEVDVFHIDNSIIIIGDDKVKKTLDIHKWEWVQPWGMVESYYSEISLCCIICECQYVFVYFV